MIFVNDLDSVRGLPWWTHHAKANIDVMTYVDMVFPFFLFIVGLSMPLAIQQRLKKNPSTARTLATRCHSICQPRRSRPHPGQCRARRPRPHGHQPPMPGRSSALAGASLFLSVYKGSERATKLHYWLRIAGLVLTVAMFVIFRRTTHDGHVALDRRLLSRDTRHHRLHLLRRSPSVHPHTPMALGTSRLACGISNVQRRLHSRRNRPHQARPALHLAISQRIIRQHHHGRRRNLGHLSRHPSLADPSSKNPSRPRVRSLDTSRRLATYTAWHLQDQSHTNLVPLQHRSRRPTLHPPLLDLRRKEANSMGILRPPRRRKHLTHLPHPRLLLLLYLLARLSNILRHTSTTVGPESCDPSSSQVGSCNRRRTDKAQSTSAALNSIRRGTPNISLIHRRHTPIRHSRQRARRYYADDLWH